MFRMFIDKYVRTEKISRHSKFKDGTVYERSKKNPSSENIPERSVQRIKIG